MSVQVLETEAPPFEAVERQYIRAVTNPVSDSITRKQRRMYIEAAIGRSIRLDVHATSVAWMFDAARKSREVRYRNPDHDNPLVKAPITGLEDLRDERNTIFTALSANERPSAAAVNEWASRSKGSASAFSVLFNLVRDLHYEEKIVHDIKRHKKRS